MAGLVQLTADGKVQLNLAGDKVKLAPAPCGAGFIISNLAISVQRPTEDDYYGDNRCADQSCTDCPTTYNVFSGGDSCLHRVAGVYPDLHGGICGGFPADYPDGQICYQEISLWLESGSGWKLSWSPTSSCCCGDATFNYIEYDIGADPTGNWTFSTEDGAPYCTPEFIPKPCTYTLSLTIARPA